MKKAWIFFLSLILLTTVLFGQGQDKIWVMGYDCCGGNFNPMNLDFNSGSLTINLVQRDLNMECTNGVISDPSGNLLFYSNGIYVANVLNDTMQNGSGLNPSFFTTNHTHLGLTLPQGNLVIPFPEDSTKYYLFHETIEDQLTYATRHLFYSVIDMTLDAGLGAVIQKNTILLTDDLVPGRLTACKHANGRDWWIVAHKLQSSLMYKFLITPSGIQGPFIQDLVTQRTIDVGQCCFSQQGDKFAYYESTNDLDIWDFDRCTGDFSNLIHVDINDSAFTGGVAFSPSGRYLYVSSVSYIYQFDLNSSNVDSSKITVGMYDGYQESLLYQNFFLSFLAPDGKIYINCCDGSHYLHIINNPDSVGLTCNFVQRGLTLPAWNAFTMPNFPNYFLGAVGNSICDSLPTGISTIRKPVDEYSLFPNPTNVDLYVNLGNERIESALLFNSLGQSVLLESDIIKSEYLHFNVGGLENGFYYLEIITNKQKIVRTFIKQ